MKNETKYTSLEFSKELKRRADKAKVKLPKNKWFWVDGKLLRETNECYLLNGMEIMENRLHKFDGEIPKLIFRSFDILNEICVEHAEFFFGENKIMGGLAVVIFQVIAQNEKEEAERYILDNLNF